MSRTELPEPAGDEFSPRHAYENAIAAAGEHVRIEHDSLGDLPVPADAYWGIHTARALVNFPITRRAIYNYPDLIVAFAGVKLAAARANVRLGNLPSEKGDAIIQGIRRVSRPGLRRYAGYQEIPKPLGGAGIAIVSTSKGVLTGQKARLAKLGGEVLCEVW